ncbi:MAG: hypothetical protein WDO72_02910 [Pseudomonadota bacterium]
MNDLATLITRENIGVARRDEPVRIGVPLARGVLAEPGEAALLAGEKLLAAQFTALARWPDRSVKWLLVDALVDSEANAEQRLSLRRAPARHDAALGVEALGVEEGAAHVRIDTGAALFEVPKAGGDVFATVAIGGTACLAQGMRIRAAGGAGTALAVRLTAATVEERGSLRASVVCTGTIDAGAHELARLKLRLVFVRGSGALRIECELWNARAARHVGGLWDLGDAGSVAIGDLSIELTPAQPPQALAWQATPGDWSRADAAPWVLYQDSSGGERWNSINHVDAKGKLTVSFRGYRVLGASGQVLAQGDRASPAVLLTGASGWISAGVERFWQNFPKALRFRDGNLSVGLLPAECAAGFELQGGEKKRHAVLLEFGRDGEPRLPAALHAPLAVSHEPRESAATRAVAYLLPAAQDANGEYLRYIGTLVDGAHSVLAKREIIDEYGWRNFGDLYADHEAVNHKGSEPFISHYNNQYDFVYGAGMQFLRTGEARWRELMVDAARHLIDIDIYHTDEDKAGFSGGLFWHTDHYQPAATCTHRTYSRSNANGPYGGGPSNEQNYTSGLVNYYYLTGDREAASAIVEVANWVIAMDDGARTMLGCIDDGPTGLASKSRDADFHKPGRGAGNSINSLLDAYSITRERRYLKFAESLIERVIHPRDDVASIGLDQPETRWSYVVFLQVLGKYLDQKIEWGETDYLFWYTRAGLLTYARWMLEHEQPYKDVLHKVELPTETWPAHDVRKSHVFHVAARHAPAAERAAFSAKAAFYFDRCLADLLSFPTAYVTRPQVILCTYGVVHGYYRADPHHAQLPPEPDYDFGSPVPFETQGARLKSTLRRKVSATKSEFGRLIRDRMRGMLARFRS